MDKLLVIIPAYNEELNIEKTIASVKEKAPTAHLLVIDDGSKDRTYEICQKLGVPVIRHAVNLGLQETVRTGMKYALTKGYEYCLQFDGDGQHDAAYIGKMYELSQKEDYDITIGSRYLDKGGGPAAKAAGRRLISFCIFITCGKKITDPTSGMRMYNKRVMELFAGSAHFAPEPDTLCYLIRRGMKVTEIPVIMQERERGKSYLDITESIRYMFRMCTSILLLQWLR